MMALCISLNSYQFNAMHLAVVFNTDTVTDDDQPILTTKEVTRACFLYLYKYISFIL